MAFRKLTKTLVSFAVIASLFYVIVLSTILSKRRSSIADSSLLESASYFGEASGPIFINTTCATVRRPRSADIRYRHEHWQIGSDDKNDGYELVVYSAFYDDRPIVGDPPWIRILGVIAVSVDGHSMADRSLYCHVWNDRSDTPFVVLVESTVTGRDHYIAGNRMYGQRQFSCPLMSPDNMRWNPTHVSISIGERCANSSILLPLSARRRPINFTLLLPSSSVKWQHDFVVCVESSFGSIPAEVVVEWIEAYRMFGVERFNIYNGNLTNPETVRVLQHYAKSGLIDLRRLPPSVDDYSEEAIRLGSPTSLNDCMMRNMYLTRFIVVVDFDEIIVPRNHSNYSAMIAHIDRSLGLNISYHTYSFRNAYFFLFYPQDETQPLYLRTMRLRRRSQPNGYLFGSKSFVDPRRCLSVFNHYCWIPFGGSEEGLPSLGTSVDVDVEVGLNHHYRYKCPSDQQTCRSYDEKSVVDDTTFRFRDELDRQVAKTLSEIGIVLTTVKMNVTPDNIIVDDNLLKTQ